MVYHANYFKFMRRAREAIFFGEPTTTPDRSRGGRSDERRRVALRVGGRAAVVAVDACRFASPVLGDDLVVRTRVLAAGARTLAVRQEVVRTSFDEDAPATRARRRRRRRPFGNAPDPSPSRERSETASSAARRTMVLGAVEHAGRDPLALRRRFGRRRVG